MGSIMRRTTKLLVTVSVALLAVGISAAGVTAQKAPADISTSCSCLDGGGGDDDDGGGGGGELEPSLDSGFILELDAGGSDGDDDDGGGSGGELKA